MARIFLLYHIDHQQLRQHTPTTQVWLIIHSLTIAELLPTWTLSVVICHFIHIFNRKKEGRTSARSQFRFIFLQDRSMQERDAATNHYQTLRKIEKKIPHLINWCCYCCLLFTITVPRLIMIGVRWIASVSRSLPNVYLLCNY